ncbi:hypothetical protein GDO78_019774 [Eleutherodactylus coqui]|uniref:Uncharacterized protein n=1 Tax=Eleutherodactylus coqui TaxID=57060 RepID=A0A8J6ECG0_ELECQ|nr:hypothetical protein GDO78_019774 [Eleutherodactylus coqui]
MAARSLRSSSLSEKNCPLAASVVSVLRSGSLQTVNMAALRAGLLAVVTRKAALASVAGRGAGRFLQCCSVRAASDLPKDLLPGPYPKTKAERAAAAKKYNMILEDYKPYPDNGQG